MLYKLFGLFAIVTLAGSNMSVLAQAPPGAAAEANTSWFLISAENGQPMGHIVREEIATDDGVLVRENSEITVRERGAQPTRISAQTVTHRNAEGRIVTITDDRRIGQSWSRVNAEIGSSVATIERRTLEDSHQTTIPLSANVRFDSGAGLMVG